MDPAVLSLAGVSGAVLTEGIKFLYGQAGELLDRQRKKRDREATEDTAALPLKPADGILDMAPAPGGTDDNALARYEEQLIELRGRLSPYATGSGITPLDDAVLADAEALRTLLEAIYRQRITFAGERRPATGTPLTERERGPLIQRVEASGAGSVAIGGSSSAPVTTNIYRSAEHADDSPGT